MEFTCKPRLDDTMLIRPLRVLSELLCMELLVNLRQEQFPNSQFPAQFDGNRPWQKVRRVPPISISILAVRPLVGSSAKRILENGNKSQRP